MCISRIGFQCDTPSLAFQLSQSYLSYSQITPQRQPKSQTIAWSSIYKTLGISRSFSNFISFLNVVEKFKQKPIFACWKLRVTSLLPEAEESSKVKNYFSDFIKVTLSIVIFIYTASQKHELFYSNFFWRSWYLTSLRFFWHLWHPNWSIF